MKIPNLSSHVKISCFYSKSNPCNSLKFVHNKRRLQPLPLTFFFDRKVAEILLPFEYEVFRNVLFAQETVCVSLRGIKLGKALGTRLRLRAATKLQHGGRCSSSLTKREHSHYLKCMVVLGAQIRRHFKGDRDLFLRTLDRSLRTQDFPLHVTMFTPLSLESFVPDNRSLLHRGRLVWTLARKGQGSSLEHGKHMEQGKVFNRLDMRINRDTG